MERGTWDNVMRLGDQAQVQRPWTRRHENTIEAQEKHRSLAIHE